MPALRLESVRRLPGATPGVSGPALLCRLRVAGEVDPDAMVDRLWPILAGCLPGIERPRSLADKPRALCRLWLQIALAFQESAGIPVLRPSTLRHLGSGLFEVALHAPDAHVATLAQRAATRLLVHLLAAEPVPAGRDAGLARWLRAQVAKASRRAPLPNSVAFLRAASRKGLPWLEWAPGIYQVGYGTRARRLDGAFTDRTPLLSARLARDKRAANGFLRSIGIPVPDQRAVGSEAECLKAAETFGWPVVVKPAGLDQGVGVAPGLTTREAVARAYREAARHAAGVVVERHVEGEDYRLLVVAGRLLVATHRIPAGVVGDGRATMAELVDAVNRDPRRGVGKSLLIRLTLDAGALEVLAGQGLTSGSVPASGRFVPLSHTANISTGGTAEDVTALVHPDNRALAERTARAVGLDIAGIDLLTPDIARSWREVGGVVCEVNAQPGFRVHWLAEPRRDLNGEVLDRLFAGGDARIPIAAITGTNGKTTVSRMLHRILLHAGLHAGVTTTQGVWVGDERVSHDNLSGYPGGRILLTDPTVEAAVIEMPRKGLIFFGSPFDCCDVAAMLNVQDDHVGRDGVETLQEMADLKGSVLRRARQAVVVNAEDALCMSQIKGLQARRIILLASDPSHPGVRAHVAAGGTAACLDVRQGVEWLTLHLGHDIRHLLPAKDIPATMGGAIKVNAWNALAAAALAHAMGIDEGVICSALAGFGNSLEQNPGRFNVVEGFPFRLMLDFGHNPDGVAQVCRVAASIPVSGRRILVSAMIGNRHLSHVAPAVASIAPVFDRVVCSCDRKRVLLNPELQGLSLDALPRRLAQSLQEAGLPAENLVVESDSAKAVEIGLSLAGPGDLLVILEAPDEAWPIIEAVRKASNADAAP